MVLFLEWRERDWWSYEEVLGEKRIRTEVSRTGLMSYLFKILQQTMILLKIFLWINFVSQDCDYHIVIWRGQWMSQNTMHAQKIQVQKKRRSSQRWVLKRLSSFKYRPAPSFIWHFTNFNKKKLLIYAKVLWKMYK